MDGDRPLSDAARRNAALAAELDALRRYARVLASGPDEANELVQETMARAAERWSQWRGDAPLRAWLYAILRNCRNQEMRRRSRWRMVDLETAGEPQDAATPSDPLLLRQVNAALAQLPDEQRETLFLVAVDGMSYAEAADVTGAPIGTVMSRLSRARARLRACAAAPAERSNVQGAKER